jgi:hypothetical protein
LAVLAALRGKVGDDGSGDGAAGRQYACNGVQEIRAEHLEGCVKFEWLWFLVRWLESFVVMNACPYHVGIGKGVAKREFTRRHAPVA